MKHLSNLLFRAHIHLREKTGAPLGPKNCCEILLLSSAVGLLVHLLRLRLKASRKIMEKS